MKTIEVEILGTTALLMHRFGEHAEIEASSRKIKVARSDPREEAERAAYRDPDGLLYVPGAAIARLIREAGGGHKMRGSRKSAKYIVPAAVRVTEDCLPLFDPMTGKRAATIEVDSRPVTIPATKGRIMRHRARLNAWNAHFAIVINEQLLDLEFIQQLLVEGGQQIGIGDYRPERGGPFGCFNVTLWRT